jgi:outer membrane protein assembly factor BamB
MSSRKSLVLKELPTLWSFRSPAQACGLHVDDREVWGGWENGLVAAVDHEGKLLRRWRLPDGVDAVIADEAWRYAGCHDGNVYDLTGKTPRVAYEVGQNARIHWIDVYRGNLCVSDDNGACTVVDADQQLMWKAAPKGASAGWMVRADNDGVYVGNSKGVAKYDWKGKKKWAAAATKWVGFGWQEDKRVFAFVGFHRVKDSAVVAIDKKSGKVLARGSTYSKHAHYTPSINAASCAAVGTTRMYAATCETLFCYDGSGKLLWEAPTSTGTPCSMAVRDDRLYVITHNGHLSAIDVSDKAIAAAKTKAGRQTKAKPVAIPKIQKKVETVAAKSAKGVIVECFKDGSKTRVRVVSPGYNADWFCQFPRDIRKAGVRFVVDEVREATQGGFYRVLGNIRKLR